MKKGLLLIFFGVMFSLTATSQGCFSRLQKAFDSRGAYSVSDDMHDNVYISYFEDGQSRCVSGKARVENGTIASIFVEYNDGTHDLVDAKFYNSKKLPPTIINGITEMIYTAEGEKFKIVFIDQLKPKQKGFKAADIPEDITISEGSCFLGLQNAFDVRGANSVPDGMDRNVIVSFIKDGHSRCVSGKARVENGKVVSVFMQYEDGEYKLLDAKFYNSNKKQPAIINGISEMIITEDGEKFKIVFIDKLKPKQKGLKTIDLPDDL